MKKYSLILWVALTVTGAFTACTDNDSPVTEQTEAKTVTIRATIDGGLGSRVALTDDEENRVVKVDWAEGDDFTIKVNGTDYTFTYTENNKFECSDANFPATFTEAGTVTATYPATTPTGYANQPGTLDGAAALLTMTATLDVEANQSTGNLALNFKHENSIVKLTLKNDAFKSKSVTGIALKSGSTAVTTATGTFTGATDGSIVAYLAVEPKTMEDIAVLAACEDNGYFVELSDNELQSGKLYDVNKTVESVIRTAEQAVKGDFALADGSFISRYATLTNEQKDNVRGIVFWTESESGSATLTSDEVMSSEYNHGLIVALTNVSDEKCVWQKNTESVANWQSKNSPYSTDYKSIASYFNDSDNNNLILGYQNTMVLKAYNASLSDADEGKKVLPVSNLEIWEKNNSAPAKTTGWFIPSAKELHMLCHKDDSYNGKGTTTRDAIDPLIETLGGKKLYDDYSYYWSSSEFAGDNSFAFFVKFDTGAEYSQSKNTTNYVRAVCAY